MVSENTVPRALSVCFKEGDLGKSVLCNWDLHFHGATGCWNFGVLRESDDELTKF